ncbi:hypothetical protein FLM9_1632, partial [Candidatus Synechococcus spongiarum]
GIRLIQGQGLGAAMNGLNGLRIQAHSASGTTH